MRRLHSLAGLAGAVVAMFMAITGAIRRFLAENPAEFDPRKYFAKTITAMRDICIDRYEAFGTAGNASRIQPISLEKMASRYGK